MTKYGLTIDDLKHARDKRETQLAYLSNNHFHTATGQVKSLLDVSFSANLSERYYSQLSNKINTMHSLAISQHLKPVFLTITLDGFFRGMLSANYNKWNRKDAADQIEYFRHIPNNEIYGFIRDKITSEKRLTIKDLYNVLNYQWLNFSKSYAFKKLKKEGKNFIYLKAAEPHKDGVPHFHVLLWIPANHFDNFKKDFERYFPAPRNHKPTKEDQPDGDTYGFQTAIHNPVGYIMKYATKSFMDLRTGEELGYLQAWYIKHKIRRLTTSHSTIPQWVYQKCFALEKDWYHLTDLNIREPMLCEWSREDDYFILIEDTGRTIEYDNGLLTLRYIDGPIIKQLGERTEKAKYQSQKFESVPQSWMKPQQKRYTDVFIDGERYIMRPEHIEHIFDLTPSYLINTDQRFVFWQPLEVRKIIPQPSKMRDYQLIQYFESLDLDTVNSYHFAHTYNELIYRGLKQGEPISLTSNLESIMWGFNHVS